MGLSEGITAHPRMVGTPKITNWEAPGAFLHARHAQAPQPGNSRNSPGWQRGQRGRHGHGSAAVPSPPGRAGVTPERRRLSQLPVTPGSGWQRSSACRLSGTRRRWLSPLGRLVSPFPGAPPAQLIPSSAAVDFGMSCAAGAPALTFAEMGRKTRRGWKEGGIPWHRRSAATGNGVWLLGTPRGSGMGWLTGGVHPVGTTLRNSTCAQ